MVVYVGGGGWGADTHGALRPESCFSVLFPAAFTHTVIPCAHTVVVCVVVGGVEGGGPLINMGPLKLFPVLF